MINNCIDDYVMVWVVCDVGVVVFDLYGVKGKKVGVFNFVFDEVLFDYDD